MGKGVSCRIVCSQIGSSRTCRKSRRPGQPSEPRAEVAEWDSCILGLLARDQNNGDVAYDAYWLRRPRYAQVNYNDLGPAEHMRSNWTARIPTSESYAYLPVMEGVSTAERTPLARRIFGGFKRPRDAQIIAPASLVRVRINEVATGRSMCSQSAFGVGASRVDDDMGKS